MATRVSRRTHARGTPPPATRPQRRSTYLTTLLLVLALAGATSWAYGTSFAGVFVFDDKFGIVANPNIKSLWPLTRAMWAPPELPVTARPVASLSLAVNYALASPEVRDVLTPGDPSSPPGTTARFLENVWGYHAMNLLLHVLAAAALMGVVRRTLDTERLRPILAGSTRAVAFAVAIIWAVHPLTTDAVTYIVQRTEVLMGLFYFLTLYCAVRAAEAGVGGRQRRWWTAGSLAACACGMGSKQTMVTAPIVVFLWDYVFLDREVRVSRRRLYLGLAATWVLLGALVAAERWPTSIGMSREGWTPWTYLLTQTGVIAHYIRLSFVPWPLVLDYAGWPMARTPLDVWPYALAVTIGFVATVVLTVRRDPWSVPGVWFFALLGPSSSVLPLATEIAAERRMYAALAGVVAIVVTAAFLGGRRWMFRRHTGQWPRVVALAMVGCVVVMLGWFTRERNRDYWSEERIWEDTVAKRPDNWRARTNYGVVLMYAGRTQEAEEQLRAAVRLKDTSAAAHASLGTILCATGRPEECLVHLERAVAIDPNYRDAYASLGEAYGAQGRRRLATKYFAMAVEGNPESPFLLNRLAWLLATSPEDDLRDGRRAVGLAERSTQLTSRSDVMSLDTLAAAYAESERFDEAAATAREALSLAQRQQNAAAAQDLAAKLELYERRQKYREVQ